MGKRTRLAGMLAVLAGSVVFAVGVVSNSSAAGGHGGLGSGAVTNYLKYVGGKAGPANPKLSPVQIGFVNQQGGAVVIGANATTGAQVAVAYANKQLGGIAGHPIKLVTCFIKSSEQEGTTCGQQFRANKKLDVIDEGGVATGVDTLYSSLGGTKPVIASVAVTNVDATQKNAVILFGDGLHVLAPYGTYAKQVLHAKTAAVVYEDEPGIAPDAQAWIKSLKQEGIAVTQVAYPPTQTDVTGPLISANAAKRRHRDPGHRRKRLRQHGQCPEAGDITDASKIVANPLCLNAQVISALGDFPLWTYGIASSLVGDASDAGVPPYLKVFKTYKQSKNAPDPWRHRQFRLDDEHDPVPQRGGDAAQGQRGEDHAGAGPEDRQGVQGAAGPRRSVAELRRAQERSGRLQPTRPVLHLQGEEHVGQVGVLATAAEVSW